MVHGSELQMVSCFQEAQPWLVTIYASLTTQIFGLLSAWKYETWHGTRLEKGLWVNTIFIQGTFADHF